MLRRTVRWCRVEPKLAFDVSKKPYRQSIHMYSHSERASALFQPKESTKERITATIQYYHTMFSRRREHYYGLVGMTLLSILSLILLSKHDSNQKLQSGLVGPKHRAHRSRLTIVLDLDETIVSFGDKAYKMDAGLIPRPYLAELLDYLSSIDAEVIVWSAASERYVKKALSIIDPTGTRFSHVISYSPDWWFGNDYYEKNIHWLKRDMKDTLIIENRPLSVRNCNGNAILVEEWVRGEYLDTRQDYPPNDRALKIIKEVVEDLEKSGRPVQEYLEDVSNRHKELKQVPCHCAFRQLPEELARGVFFFIGDKYHPTQTTQPETLPRESRVSNS